MFEEKEFKKAYREAYDQIAPDAACIRRLAEAKSERKYLSGLKSGMKTAAAACAAALLLTMMTLPVMAQKIPAVYEVIEKYAPVLADYVLPTKTSSVSRGIAMQVEAVKVEDQTAEILVSFSDAEENADLIRGKVDLYDSYRLQSYDSESDVGGCSFLKYDAAEGKAYFKIDVATTGRFDHTKLSFSVHQLLTNCSREERQLSLQELEKEPAFKEEIICGLSGDYGAERFQRYFGEAGEGDPRRSVKVLDLKKADAGMIEALTVTGIGYQDGILRVQMCRGNFADADRHAWLFLEDPEGERRSPDVSVSWQEKVEGETLLFDEVWFAVEEEMLETLQLGGTFCITEGSVKGDWKVTFWVD